MAARRRCGSSTSVLEKPPVMPLWNSSGAPFGRFMRCQAQARSNRALPSRSFSCDVRRARRSDSGVPAGRSPSRARARITRSSTVERRPPAPA